MLVSVGWKHNIEKSLPISFVLVYLPLKWAKIVVVLGSRGRQGFKFGMFSLAFRVLRFRALISGLGHHV